MPANERRRRRREARLRTEQGAILESLQRRHDRFTTDEVGGDEHAVVLRQADGSTIESLVVNRAERNAIVHGVRTRLAEPTDMSCIEAESLASQATIEATDATAALVRSKNGVAELRTARGRSPCNGHGRLERESDGTAKRCVD